MKGKSIRKLLVIFIALAILVTCAMPCFAADNSTEGGRASLSVGSSWSISSKDDTLASGTYDAIAQYGLSVTNLDDDSNTVLREIVYHVEADDIGWVSLEEYAERNETSVTWTFPPQFDLVEGDWLWAGYDTKYHETRDIPMSLSRSIDNTVFHSDGYQHAEFTVSFANTDFQSAYIQIIADEYNQVEEVDASFLVDTFATDIPYSNILTKDEHKIYLQIFSPQLEEIELGVEYNLSVDVKVELTGIGAPPIVYKPHFSVGVRRGYSGPVIATGAAVVMPDDMLPEQMHYASVSTNVFNTWYLFSHNLGWSTLLEISEPALFDPMVYDADGDGVMEIGEVLTAISDYFAGELTITQVLEVITLYFA